jgi:hypothetical protein
MASQVFNRFYAVGEMAVPGSVQSTLQVALFDALRDFLQHTNVWTDDLEVSLLTGVTRYELVPPSGTLVKRLLNFYKIGDPTRQWTRPAALDLPDYIVLSAAPVAGEAARATVSLYAVDPVDAEGNPVFPAFIINNYFEVLQHGMLWRLYAQPNKPWTSPEIAKAYRDLYVQGRDAVRDEVERRSNVFNNQNWTRIPELQRFFTNGMAEVSMATHAALQPAVFETLRDFFQNTNVWTTELNVTLTTSDTEYTLTPPAGTAIKRLMNFYKAADVSRQWVRPATIDLPVTLVVARPPAATEASVALVSLYAVDPVVDGAFIYPTRVIDEYFNVLYQGMLWQLYAQPGKPWSSPDLAAGFHDLYLKGRDAARAEVERDSNLFNNQNWTRVSAFQRFYTNGLLDLPGAAQPAMQPALFSVLSDFMQHTNVWVETLTVPALVSGTLNYTLTIPTGSAIKRLMALYEQNSDSSVWAWPAQIVHPRTLRLARDPGTQTATYLADVSLFPVDPVDIDGDPIFPSWIIDQYFEVLYSGMLWRVYAQPGKPWSNAALAATHYRIYIQGRGKALHEVQHGGVFNGQNWTYPQSGMGSRQRGV